MPVCISNNHLAELVRDCMHAGTIDVTGGLYSMLRWHAVMEGNASAADCADECDDPQIVNMGPGTSDGSSSYQKYERKMLTRLSDCVRSV